VTGFRASCPEAESHVPNGMHPGRRSECATFPTVPRRRLATLGGDLAVVLLLLHFGRLGPPVT
jgi:hypothetical protein